MSDDLKTFTLRFKLSSMDLYRACAQNMLRKAWFMLLAPIIGGINVAEALIEPARYEQNLNVGLITLGCGAFLFGLAPYLQTRSALKNPNYRGDLIFTFSADGIQGRGEHSDARMDWSLVKGISETRRYIFVHMKPGWFQIVPKNARAGTELGALKDVLRAYAPGKVKLRRQ